MLKKLSSDRTCLQAYLNTQSGGADPTRKRCRQRPRPQSEIQSVGPWTSHVCLCSSLLSYVDRLFIFLEPTPFTIGGHTFVPNSTVSGHLLYINQSKDVIMGTLRRRLRELLLRSENEVSTPSSSSSSAASTLPGSTTPQQDCKSPTKIDDQDFPEKGREESPQQPPRPIDTGNKQQDGEEPPQRPPSYSALFPHNRPESQTPTPPGMDPLTAAAWHNKIHSPIHRLPDHVLTQIIDILDNSGVECMRRVTRRFPPLCEEIIFDRPRAFFPTDSIRDGPFAWPCLRSMCPSG